MCTGLDGCEGGRTRQSGGLMSGTHPVRRSGRGRGAAGPGSGAGDQPPPDQGQPCGGADRQCGGMCASVAQVGTPLTRAREVTDRLSPSPISPMPVIRTRMRSRWEEFAPTTGLCSDELRYQRTQKRSNSIRHHVKRIIVHRPPDATSGIVNRTFLSPAGASAKTLMYPAPVSGPRRGLASPDRWPLSRPICLMWETNSSARRLRRGICVDNSKKRSLGAVEARWRHGGAARGCRTGAGSLF